MSSSLKDCVVLVTGASGGIGAESAYHFSRLGCKLSLVGRNTRAMEEVAVRCRKEGSPQVVVLTLNIGQEQDCSQAIADTVSNLGGLDVLVNNAGMFHTSDFANVTMEEVDKSMQVNLKSTLKLSQEAIPHLARSKGNIVNVSSICGLRAYPGATAYKMSEAALDQLTRCSALEVASKGIRVNSVNPGVIVTGIFEKAGMTSHQVEEYYEECKRLHPLGRAGTAEEVATAIVFLASKDASFITGQTIAIDGGRSVGIAFGSYNN